MAKRDMFINDEWFGSASGLSEVGYDLKSPNDFRLIIRAVHASEVMLITEDLKTGKIKYERLIKSLFFGPENCLIIKIYKKMSCIEHLDEEPDMPGPEFEYDRILEEDEINKYKKVGELEYLKIYNQIKYQNLQFYVESLKKSIQKYQQDDPHHVALETEIRKYNIWIRIYVQWFTRNGFELPIVSGKKVLSDLEISNWKKSLYELAILARKESKKSKNNWTYVEGYKWAAKKYTIKGKTINWQQLKGAFDKKENG